MIGEYNLLQEYQYVLLRIRAPEAKKPDPTDTVTIHI